VGPECLTEVQFIDIIGKSFMENAGVLLDKAEGGGQGGYDLVEGKAIDDEYAAVGYDGRVTHTNSMEKLTTNKSKSSVNKSAAIKGRKTMQP
jgi:hypothetical protein